MRHNKTANKGNCLHKERDAVKEATLRCVKAQDERERTHEFIKIPIFKGYKLVRKDQI
jgi:hypothetical protein